MKEVGIVGYGIALPWTKISIGRTLYIAIRNNQDDSITFGIEAAQNAIKISEVDPSQIGTIVSGSISKPYAVGQTARHIGTYVGVGKHVFTADIEVGNSGGMQAIEFARSSVEAEKVKYGLAIGTDCGNVSGIVREHIDGSGAVAVVVGEESRIATIKDIRSFSDFDREFFRIDGSSRLTELNNDPKNYTTKTIEAMKVLLSENGLKLTDFDRLAFSQPSYNSMRFLYTELTSCEDDIVRLKKSEIDEKIIPWMTVLETGDLHNASPLMSMSSILDEIQEVGKNILVTSYSPDSSMAMWLTTEELIGKKKARPTVQDYVYRMRGIKLSTIKLGPVRIEVEKSAAKPPRITGTIYGIKDAQTKKITLCHACERVYSYEMFSGRCLNFECDPKEIKSIELPVNARLESFHRLGAIDRRKVFDILNEGQIVIVECDESQLAKDMPLEMVFRMLQEEEENGEKKLFEYIPAYRPLFRDSPNIEKSEKSIH